MTNMGSITSGTYADSTITITAGGTLTGGPITTTGSIFLIGNSIKLTQKQCDYIRQLAFTRQVSEQDIMVELITEGLKKEQYSIIDRYNKVLLVYDRKIKYVYPDRYNIHVASNDVYLTYCDTIDEIHNYFETRIKTFEIELLFYNINEVLLPHGYKLHNDYIIRHIHDSNKTPFECTKENLEIDIKYFITHFIDQ